MQYPRLTESWTAFAADLLESVLQKEFAIKVADHAVPVVLIFSLIELLVVIAIIAVLAAMLMPISSVANILR